MVDNLPTYEMKEEYKESFGLFDKRGDGDLTQHEFILMLRSLDPTMGGEEIDEFMEKTQLNKLEKITIDPFTSAMFLKMRQEFPVAEIKAAFSVFDPDKKGKIGLAEMRQALTVIGEAFFSIEERETFLKEVKKQCDDRMEVDYNKLVDEMYEKCLDSSQPKLKD